MRTNIPGRLLPSPTTPEALDLRRRSLAVMRDVVADAALKASMDRLGLRERRNQMLRTDGRRGIEIAAIELVELRNAGATRAELTQMVAWLQEVAEDLCAGETVDLTALELAETDADLAEDLAQLRAHIGGPEDDPARLERARLLRLSGASSFALARALEAEVRRRTLALYRRSA